MKTEDVIKQLCGDTTGWDSYDTMGFIFYGCSKFGGQTVSINFETGILEVEEKGKYAIQVSLTPL